MPRFTILLHQLPTGEHHDLLLQWPGEERLRTWSLPAIPAPGETVEATRLPDHRAIYLDYEGPISGDRGKVTRWDTGSFEIGSESADGLVVIFDGAQIQGEAILQPLTDKENRWRIARKK